MTHARPRLVLSQCLELDACRYNGQTIRARIVPLLAEHADLVPVCPEVGIGLGVPRPPVRLVATDRGPRMVQPSTGRDVTDAMTDFAATFLGGLSDVDGFLLKSRSPSCGTKDVKRYAGTDDAAPVGNGPGLFAAAVLERFPRAAVEEEGRLTNAASRHHFLTRLFAFAALRAVERAGSVDALVRFHAESKYLLLSHSERGLRALGRIVAGWKSIGLQQALRGYRDTYCEALARPAKPGSMVNALTHALGFVSDGLEPEERAHFLGLLDDYGAGRVPLAAPLAVLQAWLARFDVPYLEAQRLLEPYPPELLDPTDSGRTSRYV